MTIRIEKDSRCINSMTDWLNYAPPAGRDTHWVDGASAKELARAFVGAGFPEVPPALSTFMDGHRPLSGCRITSAEPEVRVPLDGFRGNTRNADMHLVGETRTGRVLLDIEAKAGERFDSRSVGAAFAPVRHKPRSNLPTRIDNLCWTLFGEAGVRDGSVDPRFGGLRYQLLHALPATAIAAAGHGATVGVLLIVQFTSSRTSPSSLRTNQADLDAFIRLLPGCPASRLLPGQLLPVSLASTQHLPPLDTGSYDAIDLFVGKLTLPV